MKLTWKGGIILLLATTLFMGVVLQHAFAQTAGVPRILSYQGRLLSSSGNLLGGSGATYCFKFSLFNASSGGSQVWPVASPSIMSASVVNGVFDIGVGDTSAGGDALTYNFQDSNTIYLNVQVATLVDPTCTGGSEVFETLSPRERVVAAGYAINAGTVDGFSAGTNASGTMIPVISSDTLTLAGVNPQINATGTNTLTLQGGAGTGAIQFFSANNYITSSTLRVNGTVSANMLQAAVAPTQSVAASVVALGQAAIRNGAASGTFIGINTSGTYNGDYLEFENNSTTVFNIASSGQLTIGTSTNLLGSLFAIATSSNIFSILNNGNANLLGSLNVSSTFTVASTTNILGDLSVGTSSEVGLFTIATSSNIFTALPNGNIGIGTTTPGYSLTVVGTSLHTGTSSFLGNVAIGTTTPANLLQVAGAEGLGVASTTEGQLIFYNSLTSSTVTLQGSTSTLRSFTLTLPNATGTAGQVLVSDGSGSLLWDSTGFTKIVSSTTSFVISSTSLVVYASTTFTPANTADQLWVTADISVSSTQITAVASTTMTIFRGATNGLGSTCNGTQVGSPVTESIPRQAAGVPAVGDMTENVVDSPATTSTTAYGICIKVQTINDAAVLGGTLTIQEVRQGSDVAETYYAATGTPLTAGDVASIDPSIQDGIQQSQSPYDSTLIGIISTQPGIALGNSDPPSGVQELVALAGRVPVNVTNENGDINAGDYLTASDIPGIAMKATGPGRVVAIAMQSFAPDPSEGTTTGSVLAFVDVGWEPGSLVTTTNTTSSSPFSIGDDLRQFFGIISGVGDTVQSLIRASVIAVENLFVKVVTVLPSGSIKVPSGPDQMSGVGTLDALSWQVFIPNVQVASSSKIFVTPTGLTSVPLVVVSKQDSVGFTVGVATPQTNDIPIDWIMVQGYHVGGSDPAGNQESTTAGVIGGGSNTISGAGNPAPSSTDVGAQIPSVTDSSDSSSTDSSSAPAITDPSVGGATTTIEATDSQTVATSTDPAAAITTPDVGSSSSDATATSDPPPDDSGGDASGTTQ